MYGHRVPVRVCKDDACAEGPGGGILQDAHPRIRELRVKVLYVLSAHPESYAQPWARNLVKIHAGQRLADGERNGVGREDNGIRRCLRRAAQTEVSFVKLRGTLEVAHLQGDEAGAVHTHGNPPQKGLCYICQYTDINSVCQNIDMRQEEFNDLIGYRLKEVQSLLRSRMEEALRPLGITVAQYACLEILKLSPGASNSELARQAFVTRQTMNTLLKGLQERGLIERAAQATKGRVLPTSLTPAGAQVLAQATGRIREVERRMVGGLSDAQRQELWDLLTICIRGLHGDH